MKSFSQIRKELDDIRYYYEKEDLFVKGSQTILSSTLLNKVKLYGSAISQAPCQLYALYVALYINHQKQVSIAIDWCCSADRIKKLNKKLCEYFQKVLD